jgi:hypothetical protein
MHAIAIVGIYSASSISTSPGSRPITVLIWGDIHIRPVRTSVSQTACSEPSSALFQRHSFSASCSSACFWASMSTICKTKRNGVPAAASPKAEMLVRPWKAVPSLRT